jgi:hypothetical protein
MAMAMWSYSLPCRTLRHCSFRSRPHRIDAQHRAMAGEEPQVLGAGGRRRHDAGLHALAPHDLQPAVAGAQLQAAAGSVWAPPVWVKMSSM